MSKLRLSGVTLESHSAENGSDEERGECMKRTLTMSASWSEDVAKLVNELSQQEEGIPPFEPVPAIKSMSFGVSLKDCGTMSLTPNKKDLAEYGFEIPIDKVTGLKYTAKYDDETGVATARTIHFTVITHAGDPLKIEQFIMKLNNGGLGSKAVIEYTDPTKPEDNRQSTIPGTETVRGRRKNEAVQ